MYFVDRKKINEILLVVEEYVTIVERMPVGKNQYEMLAYERIVHVIVEGILDVGNAMIDGFIMRDPGSYEDIIDILMDEKVISNEIGVKLKNVIELRKILVQQYMNMDHLMMEQIIKENIDAIQKFPACITSYLEKEIDVVTAFVPSH